MELFGIDHRPQEHTEIVLVALGEAGFGDDVGGAGVDEQVEVMLGFGDACQNAVGALLLAASYPLIPIYSLVQAPSYLE